MGHNLQLPQIIFKMIDYIFGFSDDFPTCVRSVRRIHVNNTKQKLRFGFQICMESIGNSRRFLDVAQE